MERTGEEHDVKELVEQLYARGFVEAVNEKPIDPPKERRRKLALAYYRSLNRIDPRRLKFMQHPLLPLVVLVPVLVWVGLIVGGLTMKPMMMDLFGISYRPFIVTGLAFFGFFLFANFHELAHFLMARSYGIEAASQITHRFLLLVLETDVTNALTLPPMARLRIFLAGIGFNLLAASGFAIAAAAVVHGVLPLEDKWIGIFRFLSYLNFFPLYLQLFFVARTDTYYVISLALGERNLSGDSRTMLRLQLAHFFDVIRRREAMPCPECGGRTFPREAICLHCGAKRPVEDLRAHGLDFRRRARLVAYGLLAFAGMGLGYFFVIRVLYTVQASYFWSSRERLYPVLQSPGSFSFFTILDVFVPLLVVGIQLAMAGYYLTGPLFAKGRAGKAIRWAGATWLRIFGRESRRSGAPAPPAPADRVASED